MRDEDLRRRLLRLRERDQGKRVELLERRELHLGYHPEMERVHVENAEELAAVLERGAWPGADEVGEDGAEAAFLVALHAISCPDFQRRCRALLATAVERGSAAPLQRAMLEDRIAYNERRPQRYGTIFDWDEHGELSPWPIAAPQAVDARRADVGLPPLAEAVTSQRRRTAGEVDGPPQPYAERQAVIEAWARRTGWIPQAGRSPARSEPKASEGQ